jgi:hypothetical protein
MARKEEKRTARWGGGLLSCLHDRFLRGSRCAKFFFNKKLGFGAYLRDFHYKDVHKLPQNIQVFYVMHDQVVK